MGIGIETLSGLSKSVNHLIGGFTFSLYPHTVDDNHVVSSFWRTSAHWSSARPEANGAIEHVEMTQFIGNRAATYVKALRIVSERSPLKTAIFSKRNPYHNTNHHCQHSFRRWNFIDSVFTYPPAGYLFESGYSIRYTLYLNR